MSWLDRLKPGAYTAPDGTRATFMFEDLKKSIPKKTHAHDFPDANGSYIRDSGIKGRRYPMKLILTGDDHDIDADVFENLLVQKGPGRLEHPMYGRPLVVPFDTIEREDNVKSAAGQTVFTVGFYASLANLFPSGDDDTSAAVDVAIASVAFESQFAASVDLGTPGEAANFRQTFKAIANGARQGLQSAQDKTNALQGRMNQINSSIQNSISNGVGTPLTLASQLKQMALAPSRSAALLQDRLAAYGDMASSLVSGKGTGAGGGTGSSEAGEGVIVSGVVTPGVDSTEANAFHVSNMAAVSMVLGVASAVSVPVDGQAYTTRADVVEQIEALTEMYESVVAWQDNNYAALAASVTAIDPVEPVASGQGALDTGESYAALHLAVTAAIRHLMSTAYVLPPERVLVLDRPRSPLDLAAELYGDPDAIDTLIEANGLGGDEIFLLPIGKRVKYYPDVSP